MKQILTDGRIGLALSSVLLLLGPMVLKQDYQLMYLSILFCVLTGIFVSYFLNLRDLSRYYLLILTALAVYSVLASYVLRILPDREILRVPVFTNGKDKKFYDFILAQVPITYARIRNFGIFREPGVYQFFLILGLFLNHETAHWEKAWQLWTIDAILSITMLTTFSTGGIIELLLLGAWLFFSEKWYQTRKGKLTAAGIVLGLTGIAVWILITKNSLYKEFCNMFQKFGRADNGLSRLQAILVDLSMALRHPFLGERLKNVLHAVENNTTSTMILYAVLGILGGSFHVVTWAALVWDRKRNIFGNFLLMLIFFMSFNTQNLSWNPYFWLFPMVALAQKGIPFLKSLSGGKQRNLYT